MRIHAGPESLRVFAAFHHDAIIQKEAGESRPPRSSVYLALPGRFRPEIRKLRLQTPISAPGGAEDGAF